MGVDIKGKQAVVAGRSLIRFEWLRQDVGQFRNPLKVRQQGGRNRLQKKTAEQLVAVLKGLNLLGWC
jgi:hypothetical protein